MSKKPIFEHRHFAWLAVFAAENLNDEQTERLIRALANTNPKFDAERFASAAKATPNNRRDEPRNNEVPR